MTGIKDIGTGAAPRSIPTEHWQQQPHYILNPPTDGGDADATKSGDQELHLEDFMQKLQLNRVTELEQVQNNVLNPEALALLRHQQLQQQQQLLQQQLQLQQQQHMPPLEQPQISQHTEQPRQGQQGQQSSLTRVKYNQFRQRGELIQDRITNLEIQKENLRKEEGMSEMQIKLKVEEINNEIERYKNAAQAVYIEIRKLAAEEAQLQQAAAAAAAANRNIASASNAPQQLGTQIQQNNPQAGPSVQHSGQSALVNGQMFAEAQAQIHNMPPQQGPGGLGQPV
ncbi:hypothetical protein WOLCODRAFT_163951, partial [Wolfiporia cocos MD-104 SS10]